MMNPSLGERRKRMSEIQIVPASDFGQKRIGILCLPGLETFIKPIVAHLEENYAVRTCYSKSLRVSY